MKMCQNPQEKYLKYLSSFLNWSNLGFENQNLNHNTVLFFRTDPFWKSKYSPNYFSHAKICDHESFLIINTYFWDNNWQFQLAAEAHYQGVKVKVY